MNSYLVRKFKIDDAFNLERSQKIKELFGNLKDQIQENLQMKEQLLKNKKIS